MPTTIYVDGDACPVKEQVYRIAARHGLPVVVVANTPFRVPAEGNVRLVHVAGGPDIADDWIAEAAGPGDIVATADLPLAGRAIARGAAAIDFRGVEFTEGSIGALLATREITQHLRTMGEYTGGPAPLSPRHRDRFAARLDAVITRLLREQQPADRTPPLVAEDSPLARALARANEEPPAEEA